MKIPGTALQTVVISLALTAVGLAAAPVRHSPPLPDNPLQGRLLFESRHCLLCHGISAGESSVGPDLGEGGFSGSFLDLGAELWNHVPGMSVSIDDAGLRWPDLTPKEATALTSFLYFIEYLGRPGAAADGRTVYRVKGCGECHGFADRPGSAPDLADLNRFASPLYIAQAIWNHGPEMFETMRSAGMPWPTFAPGDLADLSAFIRQTMAAGPQQRVLVAPGNPNRGAELFRNKGCSDCHGDDASGGKVGPDLAQAGLHKSAEAIAGMMWNHAPMMNRAIRARGLSWPTLSTEELADLIAFLYFLPFADSQGDPGRGAAVFSSQGCAECHGGEESTPHGGPDLVGARASESPEAFVAAIWNHAPVMKEAILGEGKPWPTLTGDDLRDLLAYITPDAD